MKIMLGSNDCIFLVFFLKVENMIRKRLKCRLPAFPPFSNNAFTSFLSQGRNSTKQQISRLVQIESICRQNNYDSDIEICIWKSRKHCGKRRKCWLPAFSPFSAVFSKGLFSRGVKSRDCVVKC